MIKKTAAITLLALGLGIGTVEMARAAAVDTDRLWIHIHVQGPKDETVKINLPVSVVEKMAGAVNTDAKGDAKLRFNEDEVTVAELREIWNEVRRHPEATFITVDEVDSKVRVARSGGYLVVRAQENKGKREDVEMKIPATVVDALLSAQGEQLDMAAAMRALARHGTGELMTVNSEGETVRIWIDQTSETR